MLTIYQRERVLFGSGADADRSCPKGQCKTVCCGSVGGQKEAFGREIYIKGVEKRSDKHNDDVNQRSVIYLFEIITYLLTKYGAMCYIDVTIGHLQVLSTML